MCQPLFFRDPAHGLYTGDVTRGIDFGKKFDVNDYLRILISEVRPLEYPGSNQKMEKAPEG